MAESILSASGIYAIRNKQTGRVYVGSAVNLTVRLYNHRSDLNTGRHCNIKLTRAWAKSGAEAFEFVVLESVACAADLIGREQHWIDTLDAVRSGYNIAPIAGSSLGRQASPESRAKVSAALTGKPKSAEHIAKVSAKLMGRPGTRKGAVLTAETKEKMRLAALGRKQAPESIEKMKTTYARMSPEKRSARAYKAWETKRTKKEP